MSSPHLAALSKEQLDAAYEQLRQTRGLVATCVISGQVTPQYAENLSNMRDFLSRNNFRKIEYRQFYAVFVEAGRDSAIQHALEQKYDWVLQIDADAAPFPEDALIRMLLTAFVTHPQADVVGAYCQQKGAPYLPTIDTGTGKWELIYPNSGLLRAYRTGGHFVLTKTPILRAMGAPWFRSRMPAQPLQAMADFDNFMRMNLDGRNPFRELPEWDTMMAQAKEAEIARLKGGGPGTLVGEDSGFCDKLSAHGGTILIDTSIVAGHVDTKIITPRDLKEHWQQEERKLAQTVGVYDAR